MKKLLLVLVLLGTTTIYAQSYSQGFRDGWLNVNNGVGVPPTPSIKVGRTTYAQGFADGAAAGGRSSNSNSSRSNMSASDWAKVYGTGNYSDQSNRIGNSVNNAVNENRQRTQYSNSNPNIEFKSTPKYKYETSSDESTELYRQGYRRFAVGDYLAAINYFENAIANHINDYIFYSTDHKHYYAMLALTYYSLGDYQTVISKCNIGISFDYKVPDGTLYMLRGKAKVALNDLSGACRDFKTAKKDKKSSMQIDEVGNSISDEELEKILKRLRSQHCK